MRPRAQRARTVAVAGAMGFMIVAFAAPIPAEATQSSSAGRSAALQRAAEQCGSGQICFWRSRNYDGQPWRWTPASGYRDMPSYLHDHVYSFYANASACFIDWDPAERRRVTPGDYAKAYDTNFGKRIDAVGLSNMC